MAGNLALVWLVYVRGGRARGAIAVLTDAACRDQFMDRMTADMRAVFVDRAHDLELRRRSAPSRP